MNRGENGVHRDLTCAMCHKAPFTGYTYARGHYNIGSTNYDSTHGEEAHAAYFDFVGLFQDVRNVAVNYVLNLPGIIRIEDIPQLCGNYFNT